MAGPLEARPDLLGHIGSVDGLERAAPVHFSEGKGLA